MRRGALRCASRLTARARVTRLPSALVSAVLLLTFVSPLLAGCEEQSPDGLPTVKMRIGSRTFNLEVARTEAQQQKGLMKRDSMPEDHGMSFPMQREEVQAFWMKDCRFPQDILFLDNHGKVVSIHQMQAYDERTTSSDYPARYAIELNKGVAAKTGVKVGDVLDIPAEARAK